MCPPVQAAHKHLERLASAHTHLVLAAEVPLAELKVLADCVAVGDEREQ